MKLTQLVVLTVAGLALSAMAQTQKPPSDAFMGDWKGTVTIGDQKQNVCVYMIPLGNGKYEARMVEDFAKRGPYLHRLKGEIRRGQFKFVDDIALDAGHVSGISEKGIYFDASLWAGSFADGIAKGTIGGKKTGAFELKQSKRVSPNLGQAPPDGAIVLFDGKNTDQWRLRDQDKPIKWKLLPEGVMEINGGDIMTREKFKDHVLHLEFRLPYMPTFFGQARANSGVYPQGRYEVQVLDSYGLEGADNECGGIYTVSRPKVNMCAPPLQWQSYDITFTAAKFDESGKKVASARVTVVHNGVVVQDNTELPRVTGGAIDDREKEPGGLVLQDHTNPVQYRNIWIKKL